MEQFYLLTISVLMLFSMSCGSISNSTEQEESTYSYSFHGIDVSHHQGEIDWEKVPKVQFVYIKATEGASFQDQNYRRNLDGARKAGILTGSYHYFRSTSSAHEQFENFRRNVPVDQQDLIPMVDIEESKYWTRSQFQDSLRVFMGLVESHFGKAPMIYSVQNFYRGYGAPEFNDHLLMLGKYRSEEPPTFSGEGHYTIWQYSEEGSLPGIPKGVDLNRFHPDNSIDDLLL